MKSLLAKRKTSSHICLLFLELPTTEHLLVMAKLWKKLGGSYCVMRLPKNDFSLVLGTNRSLEDSQIYKRSSSIIKHYKKSKSKSIFLQSPYLEHYPDWFFSLRSHVDFSYAGYGISLSNYFEGQFNTQLIQLCKYLLAASPYEMEGYEKYLSQQSNVLFSGNPLMYELRAILNEKVSTPEPFKPRLLWAPHWSKDWLNGSNGFAQWKKTVGVILEFALRNPLIEIVVRPHPILREAIIASQFEVRSITNREALNTIDINSDSRELRDFVTLTGLLNVTISDRTLLEDVLLSSHLITDGVSIIGYWASTGKPMLVIESQGGSPFNEDGRRIISTSDRAVTSEEVATWLKRSDFTSPPLSNIDLQELSRSIHPTFSKSPMQIFHESVEI